MKILFVIPKLNESGGVAKIISHKANYLTSKLQHDVAIVTQNKGNSPLFFQLNPKIELFDISLTGNLFSFLKSYKKQIVTIENQFKPDVIIIADNGLKGFMFPILVPVLATLLLEIHCSRNVIEQETNTFFQKINYFYKKKIRSIGASSFKNVVVLSELSKQEWNLPHAIVIPNPVLKTDSLVSNILSKNVLCISRNSYEKGIDRLPEIWKEIYKEFPDWKLNVYTNKEGYYNLNTVFYNSDTYNLYLHEPVKDINEVYLQHSIYIMTSRFEAFPLVLLEAMSYGLPIVAFDSRIGTKAILNDNFSFLIENNDTTDFVLALKKIMQEENLRLEMSKQAIIESKKYEVVSLMNTLNDYLLKIVHKEHK